MARHKSVCAAFARLQVALRVWVLATSTIDADEREGGRRDAAIRAGVLKR
jgi:hypothetical protein